MAHDDEDDQDTPRNPLLDPRLAGAGGMLIAAAAIAFIIAQGTHDAPGTTPPTSASATASR